MQSNTGTKTDTDMSNSFSREELERLSESGDSAAMETMAGIIFDALKESDSDRVRDVLNGIDDFSSLELFYFWGAMFRNKLRVVPDEGKIDYIFGVPLFCKIKEVEQAAEAGKTPKSMSTAVTKNKRSCIKDFLRFQIHFDEFGLDTELDESESTPTINDIDNKKIAKALANTLVKSFEIVPGNESDELLYTRSAFNPHLKLFGYEICRRNDPDFEIINLANQNKTIMYGEAKQGKKLPQKPTSCDLSAHLCRFGFATMITRNTYNDENLNAKYYLLHFLGGLSSDPISQTTKGKEDGIPMADIVEELLQQFSDKREIEINVIDRIEHNRVIDIQEKMIESTKEVRSEMEMGDAKS